MSNLTDIQDALRWRYVRDHGLVYADRPFGDGCLPGRVGDMYATEFVDERLKVVEHFTTVVKSSRA